MADIGRVIGTAKDYPELHALLRQRLQQIQISMETSDALSGVQPGYSGKLLAPIPRKALGVVSLGPILGALGLKLIVVEDPDAIAKVCSRWTKRHGESAHGKNPSLHELVDYRVSRFFSELGRRGAAARWGKRPAGKVNGNGHSRVNGR